MNCLKAAGLTPMYASALARRQAKSMVAALINALSAIKTTNLTIELVLENAQMAISGVYQMDDDGIINTDTINLVPGTIIPKAMGSAGLQPIKNAGNFDVANLVLNDMRNNIKRALYNDMLGDPNRTPASATEVAERMADLSRRIGSAFGRLQAEMVQPVLQRVVYILKKQGRIEMPVINGREVKVRSVSPLAQAQANQDISSVARYLQLVGGTFGPEVLNLLINSEDTALYLAKKFGVPDTLVRDSVERQQLLQAAQQLHRRNNKVNYQMQKHLGLDQFPRKKEDDERISKDIKALFSTPNGKQVLKYLRSITIESVQGPHATDAELRHLEGQRYLVGLISRRIDHAEKVAKNERSSR